MGYRNLQECVADLEKVGQLRRIDVPVDPYLELAHIQRRAFRSKSPALLFTRVKGCSFPMLANLFGTTERLHYIFRDSLAGVEAVLAAKADPAAALKHPLRSLRALPALPHMLPRRTSKAPVLENRCALSGGLAHGRRPLHHPAAGLQRGSRASRPGCLQSGHVPCAAGGQRLRRRRGGPALPDPSRHRRAPCRGPQAGPEPAGEHLRGRAAGLHRGGGHAPARRPVGTALRGPAGGLPCGHALQPPSAPADAGRGGFLHQRSHPAAPQARRSLWRPCGLLQPEA